MHKIIISGLVFIDTLFLLSLPPALAQRTQSRGQSRECTVALQNARNRIEKGRKVKVVDIPKFDIRQVYGYKDYPENRPVKYEFHLKGSATHSVLNSQKLLLSISTDIIKNCAFVSMIVFGEYATENFVVLGLIGKDGVKFFECRESDEKITWGYVWCP